MKTFDHNMNQNESVEFSDILECNPMRRRLLQGGFSVVALSLFGTPALGASRKAKKAAARPTIGFVPISASTADMVRVPAGYTAAVLFAWGDPVSDGPAFKPDASNSVEDQALQAGMHHDGMHFFPFPQGRNKQSSTHGLLCLNHEYTDDGLLHGDGMKNWNAQKTWKSQAAHGVSVIEVKLESGRWRVVRPSRYARRITAQTPVLISGPAAGSPLLVTADDPLGHLCLGTLANCAHGVTPWGTYLTCEENFHSYFAAPDAAGLTADHKRYGIREKDAGYHWYDSDERFNLSVTPNESNRFGWVVEIDPWDPATFPIKRTALGRFKHESAAVALAKDRRAVAYMGDDERFEYIYKFVSRDRYMPLEREADRAQVGELLDNGTLYVAKFNADGSGDWLELMHGRNGLTAVNGFADQAEVLVRTRQAADRVGATKMDRPEWIAVHPRTGEVYCSLTHNAQRGAKDQPPADAANPRAQNVFGHILRWRESNRDAASRRFGWDVFVLCGDEKSPDSAKRGNIKGDMFGSPDGLHFDANGRLWIMTDVPPTSLNQGDYAGFGNNQMLCADVVSGEIRRFLTGPNGCEITGAVTTPDARSLFVNIQHPGEVPGGRSDPSKPKAVSSWPDGDQGLRPRSATIVIRRDDGGVVGT